MAKWLTQALMCENRAEVPCGHCPGCKKVLSGNHADVKTIAPAKGAKSLKVEDVEELQKAMTNRAYEGGRRVFILESAHLLTQQAQNKLLKTLEEPPENVTLMLLVNHTAPLLPTVISRCQQIRMQRIAAEQIESALMERWNVSGDKASHAARACDGWIGAAVTLAQDEEYWTMRQAALDMLAITDKPGMQLRIMAMAEPYKAQWTRLIELWQGLLRDAALAGENGGYSMHPDLTEEITALGKKYPREKIQSMWQACHEAQQRLASNANAQLVMDWLLAAWEGRDKIGFGDRRPL
jgi:DNA polymerase-3 subunit delta'